MKKILLTLAFAIPFFGFSQLFDFNDGAQGWIKVGTGNWTVGPSSPTGQLLVNGNSIISNFLQTNVNSAIDASTKKFVRIKLKNNTVLATTGQVSVRVRGKSTYDAASTGYTAFPVMNITSSDATYKEYFFNLSGETGWTGTMYPDIRFTKPAYVAATGTTPEQNRWDANNIEIDEIEFLSDVFKHDYTFDDNLVDSWAGENSGTNSSTVTVSGGKLIVTPGDGLKGSKASNSLYSIDATNNKFVHVIYKNNSVNRDKLRVQYFISSDNYVASYLLPLQTIVTNGNVGEAIYDATTVPEWSGNVRKLALILPVDLVANPGGYDLLPLEVDRIVINNTSATLSTGDVSKAKNSLQVYVSENTLNFRNANVSKATIFNMNGQLLKDAKVQNNTVDVSNLKAGVYMVKAVAQDNSETVAKFIKK